MDIQLHFVSFDNNVEGALALEINQALAGAQPSPTTQPCSEARANLAFLGQQLASTGKMTTLAGIGLVAASGLGVLFAPEGAPVEFAGAAEGAGLIDVGGALSTLGDSLTGYVQGGVGGAAKAAIVDTALDRFTSNFASELGGSEANKAALGALLGNAADALKNEEAACGRS
jgi:hypothetical protein